MLTQKSAPDPTCKLNISSFLTFSHSLDCLICAKDVMIIMIVTANEGGMGRLGVGSIVLGYRWGDREWVSHFLYFLFCFCAAVNCYFMAGA